MSAWFMGRKKFKWLIVGLAFLLGVGFILWNQETIRIWAFYAQPRVIQLPAFDAKKAAHLSAERRAELEHELFAEVYLWNDESRRYNGPAGLMQREKRWRDMAEEGYELAYLALTVFEPSTVQVHYPLPALRRLDELAAQGDAGAMCLMEAILLKLPTRGGIDWSHQKVRGRFWMQKGAEIGHPECLALLGVRLTVGSDGFPMNVKRGMDMILEAVHKGATYWTGALWFHFKSRGLDEDSNRRLVYCWQYQDAKYSFIEPDLTLKIHARTEASPEQRNSLERELNQLRGWHPAIEDCIYLTKQVQGE